MQIVAAILMALILCPVWAQEPTQTPETTEAEKKSSPSMDHSMDHHETDHGAASSADSDAMDHSAARGPGGAGGPGAGKMQGGSPPHDARDPHAYSGGYDFGEMSPLELGDQHNFSSLMADRLESVVTDDQTSATYDLQAWFGRDYHRVVLKAEGDVDDGKLLDAQTELLWGRALAAYWDTQLGVRYDTGEGPERTWLAFGIQGLAPYWFEIEATAYLGTGGRTAARLAAEYELLLTNRLVLQPVVELNLFGKTDVERGLGAGLSTVDGELRLRYEIRREFAPYIGIRWRDTFGDTSRLAAAAGESAGSRRLVAGLRLWF